MKNRFTTLDLRATICELQEKFQGMRVLNVYDIDSKTYLIKLAKPDKKAVILLESGIRIHSTDFEWPKNITPSSFSMKLRKHLRTRRLESVRQLGIDRIVDLQFGSNEAAYHVILELYDRGNIVLTDYEYNILNILRPRTDQSQDVRFAVHEKYPVDAVKQPEGLVPQERLFAILMAAKECDNLKKVLNPNLVYGPALIEHCLQEAGIPSNARIGKEFNITEDMPKLMAAMSQAEGLLEQSSNPCKGYILQKKEKKASLKVEEQPEELLTYFEFQPFLFKQHATFERVELDSFDKAVDEFFSKIGSQKLDMKTLQQERSALKKLDHIKKDHEKRLQGLQQEQDVDMNKARLVEMNLDLVDKAIMIVRSAIANQIDWEEIHTIVKEAQVRGDPVASSIKSLKLDTNHITMFLKDPYLDSDEEANEEDEDEAVVPMKVDVDLELTAYANARKFYDKKRKAAHKEQKTIDASSKALKNAEKKTYQTLKEAQTVASINKARKTYWFEKFLWFISSENFVVIGGRDQQQNEHIVKKYLRPGDIYVHADLHGASSVIIKNHTGEPVPPKTLNEAGTMALCNSAAWDAKVVTSAWWVHHHQVTKTAPTGEYLTTGSFMIRGKKNFLPPSYLIYGFGFIFKVDEDSVFRHKDERRIKSLDDDSSSVASSITDNASEDVELKGETSSSEDEDDKKNVAMEDGNHDNQSSHRGDGIAKEAINSVEEKVTDSLENCAILDDKQHNIVEDTVKVEKSSEISPEAKIVAHTQVGDNAMQTPSSGVKEGALSDKEEDSKADDDNQNSDDADDDDDDEASLFPDTNIGVQYTQGDRLRLQVSRTISSSSSVTFEDDARSESSDVAKGKRLSAKQRREMKKKAKQGKLSGENENVTENVTEDVTEERDVEPQAESPAERKPDTNQREKENQRTEQQPLQPKRGQKAKLKKIKEKYGDQDEEERKLRMEILASGGPRKEEKKKGKKGKHGATQKQMSQQGQGQGQKQLQKGQQGQRSRPQQGKSHPGRPLTVDDIRTDSAAVIAEGGSTVQPVDRAVKEDDALSDEEKQALLEEENIQLGQDMNELDALTGMPVPEDILHFCVPIVAPYSTLLNYKFKVKLTPGSTKRGKAAKTALHAFIHDRSTTNRERDLFKSLKDVDLSRNIPGKVKVSAPNLLKQKKK